MSNPTAIIKTDPLAQFIDNATALMAEAKIHLNPDGIELRGVEPANVGMIHESLSEDAFESYDFDGGVIGVNLERLSDAIGMAGSDDLVQLTLDHETRKLVIESGGMEFTMALIDTDSIRSEPDVPDIDDRLTATLVCEAAELQRAEKAADLCSKHIAFGASVDDEEFYAEADGDTDDVRVTWERDEAGEGSAVNDDAHSLFSLDYLKDMLKPLDTNGDVELDIGDSVPMFLDATFADGDGELTFMLAPRIESDGGRP